MDDASLPDRRYGKYYPLAKALLQPARRVLWRIATPGLQQVPKSGPVIIAANHISFLDSVFLMAVLPRRITFVGKAEYLDDWKTKHIFPNVGMIPIDRSGGEAGQAALDAAAAVLGRQELFGIFPEGTRSRTGLLYKGRTGVARLALSTGAPIVPVGVFGTDRIQPPDAKFPKLFQRCAIRFGKPIDPQQYLSRSHDPRVARLLTDEVMFEIRELSEQRYLNQYAGSGDMTASQVVTSEGAGMQPRVRTAS